MGKFSRFAAAFEIAFKDCFRVVLWGVGQCVKSTLNTVKARISQPIHCVLAFAGVDRVSPQFVRVIRAQCAVLSVGFVTALVLGTLATPNQVVYQRLATPEWSDYVQPWTTETEAFALRVTEGYGVRHDVAMEFAPWILEAAERQKLEPELLAGLVLTESSFRKNVTSSVGAIGPAQVRPEYWSRFCGTGELNDPAENIYCGAQILAYYKDRCGAEDCALQAYNIGPYSARHQAGQRYVAKVGQWRDALVNIAL